MASTIYKIVSTVFSKIQNIALQSTIQLW